ncbi:Peptidase_M75 domain-containing protein [Caenorhabditis elegans]|uniref:Peptidase_M75 domain-containing protein n=1 Tax=Caenorhabditis elegans TaxID=6239 RepID=B1Q277_CAEEL|nr:Peptidase_M75 domain-containing protein [Caenorhabditis elegans]CAQ16156.2 Peptidase_M75 domain-containing protein [Caenorhabditis elegans]|eukprot:NP_001123021.2 Uncharacterized protein CELE_T25E12.14 [Caenorhabditis elegans]
MSRFFVLILSFAILIGIGDSQKPKLGRRWFQEIIRFANASVQEKLVRNLERQNWTLPAIKILDSWMAKYWYRSKETHWPWKGKDGIRHKYITVSYQFKATKNYINYLCKTAVEQEILNSADAEKIRKLFWELDETYFFDDLTKRLFDPKLAEYKKLNVNIEKIVDLEAISDKYLKDKKQYALLRLTYFDI